jgi:plasmid stabilization system protein ParE
MRYSLHPEALQDLRDAAEFYRTHASARLSQSFLGEFEYSLHLLLEHPQLALYGVLGYDDTL